MRRYSPGLQRLLRAPRGQFELQRGVEGLATLDAPEAPDQALTGRAAILIGLRHVALPFGPYGRTEATPQIARRSARVIMRVIGSSGEVSAPL
jgi:hypothetical protein